MAASKSKPFKTARDVELTRAAAGVFERADGTTPGLRLRVYPSGTKVWVARLRATDRTTRLLTLGSIDVMTLAEAREQVRKLQAARRENGDPIAARRQRQAEELAALRTAEREAKADGFTVRKLCDRFLEEHTLRDRTRRDYRQAFDRDILPTLGDVAAAKLSSAQVRTVIKKKAKKHPVTATRSLAALSSALSWAVDQELINENPARLVKRPSGITRRTRTLSVDELTKLVRGLPAGMPDDIARAVQVMLRTGQRPGEVLGMDWLEVKGDTWVIPASRYKTGREHRVPLPPQVLALLDAQHHHMHDHYGLELEARSGPVFGRKRRDKVISPLRGDTAVKAFAEALPTCKIAPAVLHDLRRTFESRCVDSLKLDGDLVHHDVTGHVRPGVQATYLHLERLDAVRDVLVNWNDWLDALKADNVVALPARGGAA